MRRMEGKSAQKLQCFQAALSSPHHDTRLHSSEPSGADSYGICAARTLPETTLRNHYNYHRSNTQHCECNWRVNDNHCCSDKN
ncbi:hypothetical protein R5R35_006306 [Gryllus longicercus]|uniref:Uncharacterized protein n=1 Tax=Gryllus longicercus TaxID=2509291 RepID=A0AAN9W502_9ORTH